MLARLALVAGLVSLYGAMFLATMHPGTNSSNDNKAGAAAEKPFSQMTAQERERARAETEAAEAAKAQSMDFSAAHIQRDTSPAAYGRPPAYHGNPGYAPRIPRSLRTSSGR